MPFVIGSGMSVTIGYRTRKVRMNRSSVGTSYIHREINSSVVVKISTRAIRRTIRTIGGNTSCLKTNTIFKSSAGRGTNTVGGRALEDVYRTMSVPIITVNKVGNGGLGRLSRAKVSNITLIDTVFTTSSVRGAYHTLHGLARRAIGSG